MGLHAVTITGVDDHVRKIDLLKISQKWPFVEWGVLLSVSRAGSPRYPSRAWASEFERWGCTKDAGQIRRSLHLCGLAAKAAMQGDPPGGLWSYDRVQINGYQSPPAGITRFIERKLGEGPRVILQCRSEDTLQQVAIDARNVGANADVLFDPSGGRGIEPFRWPTTPAGCRLGFAGGIGPDNVLDVIRAIAPRDQYWIDMESGVRTNDRLDMGKVRSVLEQVAAHVDPGALRARKSVD